MEQGSVDRAEILRSLAGELRITPVKIQGLPRRHAKEALDLRILEPAELLDLPIGKIDREEPVRSDPVQPSPAGQRSPSARLDPAYLSKRRVIDEGGVLSWMDQCVIVDPHHGK